ncbi:MAG: formylglycine-generating enzyme family protein, partial [Nitrospinota bacterium]
DELDEKKANLPLSEIGDTTPVGFFENGKSPFGLYDMAGNVYEWVEEWYYLYTGSPAPTFKRFSGRKNKIMKGGSWYNCMTYNCGISIFTYNRAFISPGVRNNSTGFRCAKSGK